MHRGLDRQVEGLGDLAADASEGDAFLDAVG